MPNQTIISIENVKKSYGREFTLSISELTVNCGEFISIIGPSGAGKSTLLSLIGGFIRPDSGVIRISGEAPDQVRGPQRLVRTLFQDLALFPHLSVERQLELGLLSSRQTVSLSARKARVSEWIKRLELKHVRFKFPHQLSGGEKQRLALGRAMISTPAVVLLDEPMTALDFRLRSELWEFVERSIEHANVTLVVITHDPDVALSRSDRIVVIEGGGCVQIGTPKELYHNPESESVARLLGTANIINWESRKALIRPESVRISLSPLLDVDFCSNGVLLKKMFKGDSLELSLLWEKQPLCARTEIGADDFEEQQPLYFGWHSRNVTLLQ